MGRSLAANAISFLIVALIALGGFIAWAQAQFKGEGPLEEAAIVKIERGDGLGTISSKLVAAGAISNEQIFRIGARYTEADRKLKFGEYEIPAKASMEDILSILESGRGIQYRVTFAEGLTSWEVVQILNADPVLLGELDAVPPEGSLAPDTYLFSRGDTRQGIIDRMTAAQAEILAEAWDARVEGLPVETPEELLILASIIEKETGVPDERGMVASVFVNRLKLGMPLQTDPTVIYGLTLGREKLGRGLRRSELQKETPYNTYLINGLPPTPIANPGRDSILAAANPLESKNIFFVADGSGGHAFAETLDEHNRNVRAWRQIERERAAEN